ncbi:hypothetical protein EW146_g2882, partial [Bondarzewia mesenterica]
MAQPVFDEHPLETYLRQSGEGVEAMPGGMLDLPAHDDIITDESDELDDVFVQLLPQQVVQFLEVSLHHADLHWRGFPKSIGTFVTLCLSHASHGASSAYCSFVPKCIVCGVTNELNLQSILSLLSSTKLAAPGREFAERFKYVVISSSLLSSSLSTPPSSRRRSFEPRIPGEIVSLNESDSDRRLYGYETPNEIPRRPQHSRSSSLSSLPPMDSYSSAILLCLTMLSLFSGFLLLAVLFGVALYYFRAYSLDLVYKPDAMTPTLHTLDELIAANNVWDSTVNEAISILEKDERSIFYGPTSPSSPSSSLRVALHSSLHTTQTQSDNVRQLLAALTSPVELSQLSEMYAPPSPIKVAFTLGSADRPLSLPPRQRTWSAPSDKRATWNGSYAALASHGSPTKQVLRRREKRRSDLSVLLQTPESNRTNLSAPTSPRLPTTLEGVQEEGNYFDPARESVIAPEERGEFGMAALDLQRRRRVRVLETFGMPSPSYTAPPSLRSGHMSNESSISSSSRFTTMQKTRHPLSLSALHHSLQSALASKRYAASHLLALRYDEDDDESYWEDVRAVMALLTSTLADAAARLAEALDSAEQQRLRDENPSPQLHSRAESESSSSASPTPKGLRDRMSQIQVDSFAPTPSHLSRFATHVQAISIALHDAHAQLEECVASLREGTTVQEGFSNAPLAHPDSPQESPALQAYERLRRELGLALRECERGRERLLDIVSPPKRPEGGADADADEDAEDDLPLLGPDGGSEDSDKPDSLGPNHTASSSMDAVLVQGSGPAHDDATMH